MTESGDPTLCMPDRQKSCFACCPPIRPAGYEHLSYKNILKRILRENTACFDSALKEVQPITGYSCWGLGYLDPQCRLIGCLLHPARNNGTDLRFRIDYWDKCRRESCPESKTFLLLNPVAKRFLLHLSEGLDSFAYSSRKQNPLFSLLGWGGAVLSMIADKGADRPITRDVFLEEYPFFTAALAPKGNAYLLRRLAVPGGVHLLRNSGFKAAFESFSKGISDSLGREYAALAKGTPSHLIDAEQDFRDFLRLHLGIARIGFHEALLLKKEVDRRLEEFKGAVNS
jgi:hypothetical protein